MDMDIDMEMDIDMDMDMDMGIGMDIGMGMGINIDTDMKTAIDVDMIIPVLPKTSFCRFGCRISDIGKNFSLISAIMSDSTTFSQISEFPKLCSVRYRSPRKGLKQTRDALA
jgi:hypothetical protein